MRSLDEKISDAGEALPLSRVIRKLGKRCKKFARRGKVENKLGFHNNVSQPNRSGEDCEAVENYLSVKKFPRTKCSAV